jgi:hypothetical protein
MQDYLNSLELISLKDLLEQVQDDDKVSTFLSSFKCSKNKDLESFLTSKKKAIYLEHKGITRTYLYLESTENKTNIIAYFTITIKVLETKGLSKTLIKKLDGIDKNRNLIPCYLIAQLGKNNLCQHKIGQVLLDTTIETIRNSHDIVGGRFIILDSVNIDKVIQFYSQKPNSFVQLDKSDDKTQSVRMYYPLV